MCRQKKPSYLPQLRQGHYCLIMPMLIVYSRERVPIYRPNRKWKIEKNSVYLLTSLWDTLNHRLISRGMQSGRGKWRFSSSSLDPDARLDFLAFSLPLPCHRSIQFPTLHQNSLRRPNPEFLSFLFEARAIGICSFSFLPSPSSLNSAKQPLHGLFGKEREGKKNGLSESKAGGDCTLHTHLGCMQERRRERSLDLSIRGAFVFSFHCWIYGLVFSWYEWKNSYSLTRCRELLAAGIWKIILSLFFY